eukprot:TRINITY_DN639_c1_g1_i20.p4 TRINITY_DN639_c1_g1~~TRINITY_DN639_c1_g1_i20.p4  ORF type:complete len:204 (-),score=-3.99 TRINITY_DN639_c1_g1_i20:468-1079(-)
MMQIFKVQSRFESQNEFLKFFQRFEQNQTFKNNFLNVFYKNNVNNKTLSKIFNRKNKKMKQNLFIKYFLNKTNQVNNFHLAFNQCNELMLISKNLSQFQNVSFTNEIDFKHDSFAIRSLVQHVCFFRTQVKFNTLSSSNFQLPDSDSFYKLMEWVLFRVLDMVERKTPIHQPQEVKEYLNKRTFSFKNLVLKASLAMLFQAYW